MLFDLNKRRGKKKKITNLEINEVSVVDRPANMIPFAIVKSEDDKATIEKAESISIEINTDFTIDNTFLKVNGNEISSADLDSFSISFMKQKRDEYAGRMYPKYPFYFSYAKMIDGEDGARSLEIYQIEKSDKEQAMTDELKEATKQLFGEEVDMGELTLSEQKELVKSFSVINEYSSVLPPDLRTAIGELILMKSTSLASKVSEILEDAAKKIGELDGEEETEETPKLDNSDDEEEGEKPKEDTEEETEEEEVEEEETEVEEEVEEEVEDETNSEDDSDKEVDIDENELEQFAEQTVNEVLDELLGG